MVGTWVRHGRGPGCGSEWGTVKMLLPWEGSRKPWGPGQSSTWLLPSSKEEWSLCEGCCARQRGAALGHRWSGKSLLPSQVKMRVGQLPSKAAGNGAMWAWEALEMPSAFPWRRKLCPLCEEHPSLSPSVSLFLCVCAYMCVSVCVCVSLTTPPLGSLLGRVSFLMGGSRDRLPSLGLCLQLFAASNWLAAGPGLLLYPFLFLFWLELCLCSGRDEVTWNSFSRGQPVRAQLAASLCSDVST